jgi:hypothetical protein
MLHEDQVGILRKDVRRDLAGTAIRPVTYYHRHRPHQGLGNVPISGELAAEEPADSFRRVEIVCHKSLGELLRH